MSKSPKPLKYYQRIFYGVLGGILLSIFLYVKIDGYYSTRSHNEWMERMNEKERIRKEKNDYYYSEYEECRNNLDCWESVFESYFNSLKNDFSDGINDKNLETQNLIISQYITRTFTDEKFQIEIFKRMIKVYDKLSKSDKKLIDDEIYWFKENMRLVRKWG